MFFVAFDEYFSKKKFLVNTCWPKCGFLSLCGKNRSKNRPKRDFGKWPGDFVILDVIVPILWENVVWHMFSTHPKPFDHILYGCENISSRTLTKMWILAHFCLFFAYILAHFYHIWGLFYVLKNCLWNVERLSSMMIDSID